MGLEYLNVQSHASLFFARRLPLLMMTLDAVLHAQRYT